MGLIIFLAIGAILGWLAAIVLRVEEGTRIMANVAAGGLGAIAAGVFANQGSILSGISAIAIPAAVIGALVLIGILGLFRNRVSNGQF